MARTWLSLLCIGTLSVSLTACGKGEKRAGAAAASSVAASSSSSSSTTTTTTTKTATSTIPGIDTSLPPSRERGTIITSAIPRGQRVRGDGDADNPGDLDGNGDIDPEDDDSDYPVPSSYHFPDGDDRATFAFGHAAAPPVRAAIAALVKRYYAAVAAEDGAKACSLLVPTLARNAPQDYGTGGEQYLRGVKTCPALLSLIFAHSHQERSGMIEVIAVRVQGNEARAVIASRTMRAGYALLTRQAGAWRMQTLLDVVLP